MQNLVIRLTAMVLVILVTGVQQAVAETSVSGYLKSWTLLLALTWHRLSMPVLKLAPALVLVILATGVQRAVAETSVSGYLKSWLLVQEKINNDFLQADEIVQSQNVGRFMLETLGETAAFQLHYEASSVLASRTLPTEVQTFNRVGASYRMTDLQATLIDEAAGKRQVYQNLDRLNVQFRLDAGDLTLGRQAISFGAARFINPTDIFLPFDVRTFNTEYRRGVDAIRFQRPWGDLGEIDIGLVLGADTKRETSAAFLQLRGNLNGKDLNLALMEFAQQRLLGAGLQSELWDLGFWLEVAYVHGSDLTSVAIASPVNQAGATSVRSSSVESGQQYFLASVEMDYAFTKIPNSVSMNLDTSGVARNVEVNRGQHYLRGSIGVDYAFTENVFGMVEYHSNGAGSRKPEDYLAATNKLAYRRGGVFLLGQNYLLGSLGIQASPLWNINLQAIVNLDDDSAFTSLAAEWNLAEDLYIDFGIYAFAGDDPGVQPASSNPALSTSMLGSSMPDRDSSLPEPGLHKPGTQPASLSRPILQSEYGANPNIIFASIRWYL